MFFSFTFKFLQGIEGAMKTTIKSFLLSLFCISIILFSQNVVAQQTWQWGKAGANLSTYSASRTDMATDPNGNIYTINIDSNIDIDGYYKRGFSYHNICIVSFDCSGNFRWSKMISDGDSYESLEIKADDMGGIYISGAINAGTHYVNIDDDAIILPTSKSVVFVKYDTSGIYQWHFMPEPEWIFNDGYGFVSRSMCVAPNGEMSILSFVKAGAYCDGHYNITDTAYALHILSYNTDGHFLKGVPVAIEGNAVDLIGHAMNWDFSAGKFYIYNTNFVWDSSLKYGTVEMRGKSAAVGKFDKDGHNEWIKYSNENARITKLITDADGSFYIGFVAKADAVFDGYIFTNLLSKNAVPAILKYDKNNNRIWASNSAGIGGGESFVFALSGNNIACAGETMFGPNVSWGKGFETGKSYRDPGSVYSDGLNFGNYFATMDAATGKLLGVDSLLGNFIRPTQMTGNKRGGFFTSGVFGLAGKRLGIPGVDTITGYKGPTPFLVKYGSADCDKPLSVSAVISQNIIAIYPNPATNFISVDNAKNTHLIITNYLGQICAAQNIISGRETISVSNLVPGVYLLHFTEAAGNQTQIKFIKL